MRPPAATPPGRWGGAARRSGAACRPVVLAFVALVVLLGVTACGEDERAADPAAFCDRLSRLVTNDPFLAFGDRVGPQEIRAAFEALRDQADGLVAVAPEEVRPTARDYAGSVAAMDSLLAGAGYDGTQLDQRAYRVEQLRYQRAAGLLTRHLDSEC